MLNPPQEPAKELFTQGKKTVGIRVAVLHDVRPVLTPVASRWIAVITTMQDNEPAPLLQALGDWDNKTAKQALERLEMVIEQRIKDQQPRADQLEWKYLAGESSDEEDWQLMKKGV